VQVDNAGAKETPNLRGFDGGKAYRSSWIRAQLVGHIDGSDEGEREREKGRREAQAVLEWSAGVSSR